MPQERVFAYPYLKTKVFHRFRWVPHRLKVDEHSLDHWD